jgi:hypothetical protein
VCGACVREFVSVFTRVSSIKGVKYYIIKMGRKRIPHKFENGLEYKRCSTCTTYKLLEEFHTDARRWDKKVGQCKCCEKRYYQANKEKITVQTKKYREENKGKLAVYQKKYREENKEKVKARQKKSYEKNKEKRKAQNKRYTAKPETKAKNNRRERERRKNDPEFRLRQILRSRLQKALKAQGIKKTVATMKLCGCKLNTLKRHIEKQFKDGMSWNLRSSFHIDHIIPCSAFNLSDEIEQRACFWFRNLQPLPPSINMSKNAKFNVEDKDRLIQQYIKSKKNMYNSDS